MKSFPSTFSKNDMVSTGMAGANLKQMLKNVAGSIMNNVLGGQKNGETTKAELYEKLTFPEYDYYATLDKSRLNNKFVLSGTTNITNIGLHSATTQSTAKKYYHENAFKIPAKILDAVNRYKYVFTYSLADIDATEDDKGKLTLPLASETALSQSIFNPWFGVRVNGLSLVMPIIHGFDPTTDGAGNAKDQVSVEGPLSKEKINITVPDTAGDVSDCSIQTLVNLSGGYGSNSHLEFKDGAIKTPLQSLGRAKYRWSDFMYCKDLGKVSNNHLITLRKFNSPIGDNIFYYGKGEEVDSPDKGRLISWFGTDDNKLENICKFDYEATWKQLNGESMDVDSKEDDTKNKFLPSLINLTNKNYVESVYQGISDGSQNALLSWMGGKILGKDGINDSHNLDAYYHKDKNKVYEPKNTVRDTHIYEGKLVFSQEFSLKFSYKLRSYDGINPKAAFLDLLGNILEVTYRRGSFWGGAYRWKGAPRNNAGWKKANKLIDDLAGAAGGDVTGLLGLSPSEWGNFLANGQLAGMFKNMISDGGALSGLGDMVEAVANGDMDKLKEQVKAKAPGAMKAVGKTMLGMLKNKLGRPAVYGLDSIVSGEPVGLWHLTVGNPRNPILAIGNLILTKATVQQSGPLGIDDFPTELSVTVTLKHAKSRDITDIANMYTVGKGAIYHPIKNLDAFKRMFPRVWNTNASAKIEYEGTDEYNNIDEVQTLGATNWYAGQKSGEKLQLREEDRPKRSTRRPIDGVISVGGSAVPERANLGFDDDESIKKLQLQYILRNL